jgi:endonuclease/exonuclease/phosphatase (EEP) superfamily protein YafD
MFEMFHLLLRIMALLVIVATLLPISRSHRWWIRICDFPRFQLLLLALGLPLLFFLFWPLPWLDWALIAALAAAFLWQMSWIWRYLPLTPREVPQAKETASNNISFMTTNVFQASRDAEGLLNIIHDANPDVFLAVETDEWWCSRLGDGLRSRYPHSVHRALSNGYGICLFSRLELVDPEIRYLIDEAIPSIKSGIRLSSGAIIDLYGMHPQPPAPVQDSTERDTELLLVGTEISQNSRPAVVLGDLNDVAWSPSTSKFKRVGKLLDPRRGRGFFNTYPANWPGLRYPLDYIFHTPQFSVRHMRVLRRFGSDHLPLVAALSLEPNR